MDQHYPGFVHCYEVTETPNRAVQYVIDAHNHREQREHEARVDDATRKAA
jgi:hypothetical protein